MPKTFTCTELLVLKTEDRRDGKVVLRVVQWNKNKPKLEKRGFYTQDGELKPGKAEGFSAEDLEMIFEKKDEIKAHMVVENKKDASSETD